MCESISSHYGASNLKSVFDLRFKLKTEISTFNRDISVLRLNIPCDSYMTFFPVEPVDFLLQSRVLIVYDLVLCVLFMCCLVTFLQRVLWEFHYKSLFNFHADLHASLDTHKDSRSSSSGAWGSSWIVVLLGFFPRLTTIRNQFSRRWQSFHNAHAACCSSLNIFVHWERVPRGLYKHTRFLEGTLIKMQSLLSQWPGTVV